MSTVAEQLRDARQARNLTIHQVAEVTKIRTDHLRALEEGNYDVFAAPIYVRGFVRTYAALLKLDVPQLLAALDAELAQSEKFRDSAASALPPPTPLDRLMLRLAKFNWRKGAAVLCGLAIVGLIVAAVVAWHGHRTADPLAGVTPPLYEPTQSISGDTLPLPPPPASP